MSHDAPISAGGPPGWLRRLLSVPLAAKLAGANALVVVAAIAIATAAAGSSENSSLTFLAGALVVCLVLNVALVAYALRPIRQIELAVQRVWKGDLGARVPDSLLADRDMQRVGRTVNLLLDELAGDNERVRRFARQLIHARDSERATVARALHDSAAQSLAALALQASAAARDGSDTVLAERLQTIREIATGILNEVRVLGQSLHPSALDDLGLPSALRSLARDAEENAPNVNVNVSVGDDVPATRLPSAVALTLYNVAREGVQNAVRHGHAHNIEVDVSVAGDTAQLTVADNGRGFDVARTERDATGTGLFGMRERLAMIQGQLKISSSPDGGTRLLVTVPLQQVKQT